MSSIDKRALREAAEKNGDDDILALLDELEAKDKAWSAQDNHINQQADRIESLEKKNGELGRALGAAEKRNVEQADIIAKQEKWIKDVEATMIAATDRAEAAEKRISELESDNAYIRNRHKELDLLIGKNILVMQAAIIEWQGTGDARKGLAWIYNTLFGPGELPDEAEKDAQAYFDRKYAPLDEELMNLHRWFWEQSEAERAAEADKGEAS